MRLRCGFMVMRFITHVNHQPAIKSLFRELIRQQRRIPLLDVSKLGIVESGTRQFQNEFKLMSCNPQQYLRLISDEMKYIMKQDACTSLENETIFLVWFNKALELIKAIEDKDLEGIIETLLFYRERDAIDSNKKYQHYKSKGIEEFTGKISKTVTSKLPFPIKTYQNSNNSERLKRFKNDILESKTHKFRTTRKYLKHLQLHQQICIPQRLPFTKSKLPETNITEKIIQSTSSKAMNEGYNFKIIESIIGPEMEHKINYHHYMDKIQKHLDKGPYQPKIRFSSAGMKVGFIQLPTYDLSTMREIAIDSKKSAKLYGIIDIWESRESERNEKKNKDGSFDIAWSKMGDKMYSKEHHEKVHDSEAMWEYLLDKQLGKHRELQTYIDDWRQPLEMASDQLKKELHELTSKYRQNYLKTLKDEQKQLTEVFNDKYQVKVDKYDQLVHLLALNKVTIHSDLVNNDTNKGSTVEHQLVRDDHTLKHSRKGIPFVDRINQPKRLSDYLNDVKLEHYKIGMRYDKKFNVNM
ncbi:hypothetical protein CLIB1444_15S01222 [[Candida] jaroonii]|uniref:Uncharacterized protein n=1 Tax=[Candida] jaroonii TaxID=467808 RepID=A0ACA9YFV5_9ASCO|nr:hypothetical protein CLIB1444_15S01222 [[Candida] jaroonii]